MAEIELSRGLCATIDSEDVERVAGYTWHAQKGKKTFYARSSKRVASKPVFMHQVVLGEFVVRIDHKDGNGLNNRKSNLRRCNGTQNLGNTTAHRGSSSRFKGVGRCRASCRWKSYITVGKKYKHLGYFEIEEDAARAYDAAAVVVFGEFCRLNFPEDGQPSAAEERPS